MISARLVLNLSKELVPAFLVLRSDEENIAAKTVSTTMRNPFGMRRQVTGNGKIKELYFVTGAPPRRNWEFLEEFNC